MNKLDFFVLLESESEHRRPGSLSASYPVTLYRTVLRDFPGVSAHANLSRRLSDLPLLRTVHTFVQGQPPISET